jgi:hypothetical protein
MTLVPEEEITTSKLNVLLGEYVDSEGNVDYSVLEREGEVQRYVDGLKDADTENMKGNARLAFWINAYNMLTIYGILRELKRDESFAQKGNKSYVKRFNFFYRTKNEVGGRKISLYKMENQILRKEFAEPRIHFALNCGSASCPLLKDGLYSDENLDAELEAATTLFVRSPSGTRLDREKDVLHLSSIFKWYSKDFEKSAGSVLNFVRRYMADQDREYLENNPGLKIEYQPYDWGPNMA